MTDFTTTRSSSSIIARSAASAFSSAFMGGSSVRGPQLSRARGAPPRQRGALVHRHMIRLVAPYRVLRSLLACMVGVALVVHVSRVYLDDPPAHPPRLRAPTHAISDLEPSRHGSPPESSPRICPVRLSIQDNAGRKSTP